MLVLSRKANQSVRIGDNITINVVRIKGNTIQLGIEAPKDIPVVRAELTAKKDGTSRVISVPSNNKLPGTALLNSPEQDRPRPNGSAKAGTSNSAGVNQATVNQATVNLPVQDRHLTMRLDQDSLSDRCLSLVF
jgi:carbon storage regulator